MSVRREVASTHVDGNADDTCVGHLTVKPRSRHVPKTPEDPSVGRHVTSAKLKTLFVQ